MSDRLNTPLTNEHFMDFMRQLVGMPYWYGTCLYKCTSRLLSRKAKQYPSHYGSSRMSTYERHIEEKKVAGDCIGAGKGYAWTGGGKGVLEAIGTDESITSKYGSNGCPDKGTSGMFAYAKDKGLPWGTIGTLPEVVGLAVTTSGHVGFYDGDGWVIEFKSFGAGAVRTRLKDGKWTHWYAFPPIDYGAADMGMPGETAQLVLGGRLLQLGSRGADVRELQKILVSLGYDLGKYGPAKDGVDGSYGSATEKAVRRFQQLQLIKVDGKYGSVTHKALMGVLAEEEAENSPDIEETVLPGKHVCITASSANLREGPGTVYKLLTVAEKGEQLPFVAAADALPWLAVEVNGKIGWIRNDLAQVRG